MAARVFLLTAFIVVVLTLSGARFDVAQATEQAAQSAAQAQHPGGHGMMQMCEQMMAGMTAGDAKLDALVKEMNAAKADTKVTALAAVVTELVQQHKAMHSHIGEMHQHMMGMGGMATHR